MKKLFIIILTLLSTQQGFSQTANTTEAEAFSPNGDRVLDVFRFAFANMEKVHVKILDANGSVYVYVVYGLGLDGQKYERKGKINLTR